jgi:hypothetical protein
MEKYSIKRLPREEAAKEGREALNDLFNEGKTAEDTEVRALWTLIDHAETMDDKTTAGGCLILGGVMCAAVAIACALCGVVYIPMHYLQGSLAMRPYAFWSAVFAVSCFTMARLTKSKKKEG